MRSCAKSVYKAKCISQKDERMASKGVKVNGGGGEERKLRPRYPLWKVTSV